MTIFATCTRNQDNSPHFLRIEVTEESLPIFQELINRALNCWDNAPKDIKDLGDMLTHGYVTQDHNYKPMGTKDKSRDYYTDAEKALIANYILQHGQQEWMTHLNNGTVHKVLKGEV